MMTRKQCVELLDMLASNPKVSVIEAELLIGGEAHPRANALTLADLTLWAVHDFRCRNKLHMTWAENAAEAAALLREGWNPGDLLEAL